LLLLEAGGSAAFDDLGYQVTTNFAVASFLGKSGGVMPIGAYKYSIWFADNSSNPFYDFWNSHVSARITQNYHISYQQQGLSADVACKFDDSSPLAFTVDAGAQLNSNISLINPTVACPGTNPTPLPQQIVGADFVLASSCSDANQTQWVCRPNFQCQKLESISC
jgi:hypothetical protein